MRKKSTNEKCVKDWVRVQDEIDVMKQTWDHAVCDEVLEKMNINITIFE